MRPSATVTVDETNQWSSKYAVNRPATSTQRLRFGAGHLLPFVGFVGSLAAVHGLVGFTRGEITRVVVVVILVALVIVMAARVRHRPIGDPTGARQSAAGLLATMWVAVTVGPLHTIARRPIHDAVSAPGTDALVEVVGYGGIAVVCVVLLRDLVPDLMDLRPPLPLLLFPLVATLSATWSSIARYSFGKGVQFLVLVALAEASFALVRREGGVDRLFGKYLRGLVAVAFVLIIARVVFGPIYITGRGDNLERFALIGMNANLGAFLVGLSLVIVIAAPARVLRMSGPTRVVTVLVFVAALVPMQSRTSLLTLASGLGTVLILVGRRNDRLRIRIAPMALALVAAGVIVFRQELGSYVLRGGSTETITGANGRVGLWGPFLRQLKSPFDAFFGLGYGQSKLVLIDELSWATNAHNSILSVVVGLGIVGLATYLALLAYGLIAVRRSKLASTDLGPLVLALMVMLGVQMGASDAIAEPAGGFALLYMLIVVAGATAMLGPGEYGPTVVDDQGMSPAASSTAASRSVGSSISTQSGEATGAMP